MTKVTILGQSEPKEKELKKIEFVCKVITDKSKPKISDMVIRPHNYLNIELVRGGYHQDCFDILFAYDNDRSKGILYLGHFNDGVV